MALNLGGVIRLTYSVKDDAGAPANPSAATLTITQPDLTLAAGIVVDITPTVTGTLVYDFAPVQSGLHSVRWATTGPSTAEDDVFTVEAPGRMLVSVDEAVNHLGAAGIITSNADRETLQSLCIVVTDGVERDLGRVIVRRTFTETHDGGTDTIVLRSSPIISITGVVDGGVTLSGTDYLLRSDVPILHRGSTSYGGYFYRGRQSVVVTGVAGYSNPPPCTRYAALGEIQNAWQSSQQASHPLLDDFSGERGIALAAPPGLTSIMLSAYNSLRAAAIA